MARTSSSLGVGIAITVLSVLSLALFVLAAVSFGKFNKMKGEYNSLRADVEQYVKPSERQDDTIRTLAEQAKREGQSVVRYVIDSYAGTMQRVTGNRRETLDGLGKKLDAIEGGANVPLLAVVADRDQQITNLKKSLEEAESARTLALADLKNEVDSVTGIRERHQETVNALSAEVGKYKEEVERYRQGTDKVQSDMDARVSKLTTEGQTREDELLRKVAKLQEESIVQQGIIADLRSKNATNIFSGTPEYALVDGNIIGLSGGNQAVISLGRRNKVQLGMTFSVYTDAAAIKADPNTGEYLPGKGALEVINVGESTSTCRIKFETRGNPIVPGDVIANPVYDPNKVYRFLVYGNFDVTGDGLATPLEQEDLRGIIESWGGQVVDELSGDTDFLVLGERPVLPPKPSPDSPIEILQEYIRLNRIIDRYNELYKQAIATGLPVLNENRLYTLIGRERAGSLR